MPESSANKSEKPTPKRLKKAREEGQVAQSQEFASVVTLIVMLTAVGFLAKPLLGWAMTELKQGFSANNEVFANSGTFLTFVNSRVLIAFWIIAPILAALVVAGVMSNVVVSGPTFSSKAVSFKLSAINPAKGFQKIFGAKNGVKLITSILKLIFVGAVAWFYLHDKLETLAELRWAWSTMILTSIAKLILGLMIRVCIALLLLGLGDLVYQKWKYIKDLMMTKQEVKDERKETDGSPEVKNRIRKMQFQTALKRIVQEVPKASVILVNPTHYAVAVRYEAGTMESPVLLAKGVDHMAEKIRETARAYGIPILRRPELTRTIHATVKPGEAIPPELYVAVAEVLAMIHRIKQRRS